MSMDTALDNIPLTDITFNDMHGAPYVPKVQEAFRGWHRDYTYHPETETLLRKVSTVNHTFYEDDINAWDFPNEWSNSHYDRKTAENLSSRHTTPFEFIPISDIKPGTVYRPNGTPVFKTHLDPEQMLCRFKKSNILISASHSKIPLKDFDCFAKDPIAELQEPSLTIGDHSIIYIKQTNTVLYNPDPIILNEPNPDLRESRYAYISELMPMSQMYVNLHPELDSVSQSVSYYHVEIIDTLRNLHNRGIEPRQILSQANGQYDPDSPMKLPQTEVRRLIWFIAKTISLNPPVEFNNWINGIQTNKYPLLILKED